MVSNERCIEVFVLAIAALKSRFHPYLAEQAEGLWILHDTPGRRDQRKTEIVNIGQPVGEAVERISRLHPEWHFLCHFVPTGQSTEAAKRELKACNYRLVTTELMYCHFLENIGPYQCDPPIRSATTQAEADAFPCTSQHKPKLLQGSTRFVVADETTDFGWVSTVPIGPDAWVSDLFVRPDHRGKGYGAALMNRLLAHDRDAGVRASILLASKAGARLYPHLGYELRGTLLIGCPRKG